MDVNLYSSFGHIVTSNRHKCIHVMQLKICGFQDGYCGDRGLLGYINSVRTLQEICYFSDRLVFPLQRSASYRLCGLVVSVPGYRPRGPGFDYTLYSPVCENRTNK
jgi:hypothetical protein